MEITRDWIHQGLSVGALPLPRCIDSPFSCPFASASEGVPGQVDCVLLHRTVPGAAPPCKEADWLVQAARTAVIH